MANVLIIGGAGFIGSHTADFMQSEGHKIKILDNLDPTVHDSDFPSFVKNKGFELIRGDAKNREDLERSLRGVDYIIHLAAHQDQVPNFSKFFEVNTESLVLLYEIINQKKIPIRKILYASSQFVYGDGYYMDSNGNIFRPELRTLEQFEKGKFEIRALDGKQTKFMPFEENQDVNPTNSYGLSKNASEMFILRVGRSIKIPSVIARYSIVQGERQSPRNIYSGALRIFVMQALSNEPITVYEDGNQLRDFVNVHDVVRANALLLESDKSNFEIYNVGGGEAIKVIDFANKVREITRCKSKIKVGGFRITDTRNAVSDISKIKVLGWNPKFGIEKSIRDYISWIKKEGFDSERVKGYEEELKKMGITK